MQPSVKTLSFTVPNGTSYVDLSLAASIANRRFYRQGIEWAVAGFTIFTVPTVTGGLDCTKIPETWVASNAWMKSYSLWREMNDQVLETNPSISGKYADFKIYADATMVGQDIQCTADPSGLILTPQDYSGAFTDGDFSGGVAPKTDWEFSKLEIPNDPTPGLTADYVMHMVGDNTVGSMGLIRGYALSRSRPQLEDPNVPGTGASGDWMTNLFDDGNQFEEIKEDLVEQNDRSPYPVGNPGAASEFYPGGGNEFESLQIHDNAKVTSTTVGGKTGMRGGTFQCGLIRFDSSLESPPVHPSTEPVPATCVVLVHLVAGPHRGYMCRPMQDV